MVSARELAKIVDDPAKARKKFGKIIGEIKKTKDTKDREVITVVRPRRRRRGGGGGGGGGGPSPPPSSGVAEAARQAEIARAREAAVAAQRLLDQTAAERKRQLDLKAVELRRRQEVVARRREVERRQISRPRSVVRPFVRPSFTKRQRIRLGAAISEIVLAGKRLGENKRSIDKEISDRLKKLGVTDENINKVSVRLDKLDFTKELLPVDITTKLGVDKLLISARVGVAKGIRDKPTTAVISFGVGKALPSVTKFLGGTKIIKKTAGFIPGTIKKIGAKTIPKALVTSYVASSGLQVATQPKGKRAEEVGRIAATEVIPFKLGTKSAVRGLLRSELQTEIRKSLAKLPKRKQAAFKELMEKAELLKTTKVDLTNVDLKRLKRIPDAAKPTILKFLKEKDIIVGGSLGQQTAIKPKRTLEQSDLDLYLKGDPIQAAKALTKRLQDLGIKRVVRTGKEVRIAGKKAAEFQKIDRLLANIESVIPRWRSPSSFIVRGKDGIRVPKITVQLKRKLVGGFTDPKRAKRTDFKDLKDAKDILDKLFKKAELQARGKFFFREQNIKALENKFGVKISRKPVDTTIPKKVTPTKIPPRKKPPVKFAPKKITPTRPTPLKRNAAGQFVKRAKPSQAPSQRPKPSQVPIKGLPSQIAIRRRPTPGGPSQVPTRPRRPTRVILMPKRTTRPSTADRPSQPPVQPIRKKPPTRPSGITRLRRPTKKVPKAKLVALARARKKLSKKGLKQGYNVFGKSGKKFWKLNKSPMEKRAALDRGSFASDVTTSRQFKIVPAGRVKKFLGNKKNVQGHFSKNRNKLRNFRVVKGKRILLKNRFIERVKHAIDSRGEVSQLSVAKLSVAKLRRERFGFGGARNKVPKAKVVALAKRRLATIRRSQVRSPSRLKRNIPRRPTRRPPTLKRNTAGQFVKRRK